MKKGILSVDTDGFRLRVAWRGLKGVLSELISNALDEDGVTYCAVCINKEADSRNLYRFSVEDDSTNGFRNLDEATTLYAPSYKAAIADKSGRFNVGEKIAVVLCESGLIESTTGTIRFSAKNNSLDRSRSKRDRGTRFEGLIRLRSGEKIGEVYEHIRRILPPAHIKYTVDGEIVFASAPLAVASATLPTVAPNDEGELVRTERKTKVRIYRTRAGEQGWLYELGVPVVRADHPLNIDVRQKIPLSVDRNNVTPGFYRRLCAVVLDAVGDQLTAEEARSKGVVEGIALAENPAAILKVAELRHGENRFVPDPNNREGVGELTAKGYQSVGGGSYDAATWERLREVNAIPSVNALYPKRSKPCQPYTKPPTPALARTKEFAEVLCAVLLGKVLTVRFTDELGLGCAAQCGSNGLDVVLTFHVRQLGEDWFSEKPLAEERIVDLLLHELGHHEDAQDCTREHCNEVTRLAAKLVNRLLGETILRRFA